MSERALAIVALFLMVAGEGYSLGANKPFKWENKYLITMPLTGFIYWLLLTVIF